MIRITVACPEGLRDDANHFAMAVTSGPENARTYGEPYWRDGAGNLYAAASFEARPEWVMATQSSLDRPEWDGDYTVNMAGAERAQDALVFWTPAMGGDAPQAAPGVLTAIGGMNGPAALAAMGLALVEIEEDPVSP